MTEREPLVIGVRYRPHVVLMDLRMPGTDGIADAVRTVASCSAMLAPTVTRRLISMFAERKSSRADVARERRPPSPREASPVR
ncbi:hypothetical protein AB0H88_30040 [Nonomuraea sp. NPDC050680]|uniref:hypothetical protein n=1 Tax=Nonomuraea sp. NPDC050680 TaxID=3154630 RepID=UPI0033CD749B